MSTFLGTAKVDRRAHLRSSKADIPISELGVIDLMRQISPIHLQPKYNLGTSDTLEQVMSERLKLFSRIVYLYFNQQKGLDLLNRLEADDLSDNT